jgi:hypothetical protein
VPPNQRKFQLYTAVLALASFTATLGSMSLQRPVDGERQPSSVHDIGEGAIRRGGLANLSRSVRVSLSTCCLLGFFEGPRWHR